MVKAIKAVKNGMSLKRAVEMYGVPSSALRDHISGKVIHGTRPGPRPYLSGEEEKELGTFLNRPRIWQNQEGNDPFSSICGDR